MSRQKAIVQDIWHAGKRARQESSWGDDQTVLERAQSFEYMLECAKKFAEGSACEAHQFVYELRSPRTELEMRVQALRVLDMVKEWAKDHGFCPNTSRDIARMSTLQISMLAGSFNGYVIVTEGDTQAGRGIWDVQPVTDNTGSRRVWYVSDRVPEEDIL